MGFQLLASSGRLCRKHDTYMNISNRNIEFDHWYLTETQFCRTTKFCPIIYSRSTLIIICTGKWVSLCTEVKLSQNNKATFQLSDKIALCNFVFFWPQSLPPADPEISGSLKIKKQNETLLHFHFAAPAGRTQESPRAMNAPGRRSFMMTARVPAALQGFNSHRYQVKSLTRERGTYWFDKGKQNKTKKKLIESIKLYLQEIQVIHSVRKKAFKAHSKIMYSKKLKRSFSLRVLYTKHAT